MLFDSAGVLRSEDGSALAHVKVVPDPAFAGLIVGSECYEILRRAPLGWHFQLARTGGEGLVYDFHPGLRRGGALTLPSGEPVAQIVKRWPGRSWNVVPQGHEEIAVRRTEGIAGSVVAPDGEIVAPPLEVSVPPGWAPSRSCRGCSPSRAG